MTSDSIKQFDLPANKIFSGMLGSAVIFFERHVQSVNELNVFPVPDGDTGTNMFGTLKGIQSKIQPGSENSLEDIMKKVSDAALLEGRGNSGIILSQIFRGLYEGFDFQHPIDIDNLSTAMDKAAERAYGAVGDPVEGTMLTVLSDIANTCNLLKTSGTDICNAFGTLHASAVASVDGTPTKLNVLNDAGVVDSGGYGLE
ncbi:MAG: DAK2 domain-containing protein, partial [SAR202 cluster bacterium]|nr:DAK2 domain-containing protein [SAR202 cluster bacterium]